MWKWTSEMRRVTIYIKAQRGPFMYRDASHLWRSFSHNRTKINILFLNKIFNRMYSSKMHKNLFGNARNFSFFAKHYVQNNIKIMTLVLHILCSLCFTDSCVYDVPYLKILKLTFYSTCSTYSICVHISWFSTSAWNWIMKVLHYRDLFKFRCVSMISCSICVLKSFIWVRYISLFY